MISFDEAKYLLDAYREDHYDRDIVEFVSDYDLSGENTNNHPQSELLRAIYCAINCENEVQYKHLISVTEIEDVEDELL
jgi:hypothetical protein